MAIKKKKAVKVAKKPAKKSVAGKKPAKKATKKPAKKFVAGKKLGKPNFATPSRKATGVRAKAPLGKPAKKSVAGKPVGVVTHFFGHISVGIVKFSKPVKVGTTIRFLGANTDFTQTIASMQYEHQPIVTAKKGQQVGIKVKRQVHEGNKVYLADK